MNEAVYFSIIDLVICICIQGPNVQWTRMFSPHDNSERDKDIERGVFMESPIIKLVMREISLGIENYKCGKH